MLHDDQQNEKKLVINILNTTFLLMKHLRIYAAENRLVEATTSRLLLFFESYLRYHETFHINIARHGFIYADDFIERKNKTFVTFAYSLFQHGIAAITVTKDVSAHDLHTFLTLIGRPPAESWGEGGISRALQIRSIKEIQVREMSEDDIAFIDGEKQITRSERLAQKSPLWDRFAFAVYHGLTAVDQVDTTDLEEVRPATLAQMTNQILGKMPEESQQKFSKSLTNYLSTLQSENIRPYRATALAKLTEYINRISPEIRYKLFQHIFNLNLNPDFCEEFYAGLSDEIILEILEQSTQEQSYVPPVILKILGKIASNKPLEAQGVETLDQKIKENKADIVKLFQKDDFDQFVPAKYQTALTNIIQHDTLPREASVHIEELKRSLEEDWQEKHSADIVLKILNESPDPGHVQGLDANLVGVLPLYLEAGDYQSLITLQRLCLRQAPGLQHFKQLRREFASASFIEQIINGVVRHDKKEHGNIETLVVEIGNPFIAPLLEKLAMETNRSYRKHYLQLLLKLDAANVGREAVKRLDDRRWFFLRNILYLLRALNNPEALPYIKPLMHHPHLNVSSEALRACLQYGSEEAKRTLLEMLSENNPKIVENAISLAQVASNEHVVARLIQMLEENNLLDYCFEQKKAIVQSLAEIAQKQALPVFSRLLTSRNLLHPKQHARLKEEVIKILGRLDPAQSKVFLEELITQTKGDTRDKLQVLLKKGERGHV